MEESNDFKSGDQNPSSVGFDTTLEKLMKIEEKLKVLREFSEQSEELRVTRNRLLDNLVNSNKKTSSVVTSDSRRVKFADDFNNYSAKDANNLTRKQTSFRPSIMMAQQRSKSLHNLMSNLQTWQGEVKRRKSEIESLKTTRQSITEPDKAIGYEERIRQLESEEDEMTEKLLHFVLQNVSEGKEEYQEFIMQLEDENKEMEDRIVKLQDQIKYLKENNKALMRENESLRLTKTTSLEDVEQKYRKSFLSSKTSSYLITEGSNFNFSMSNLKKNSKQSMFEEENEDKLSLDQESEDSFQLDKQIAFWKMDDESMYKNLKKLEQEVSDMEVIQMKLDFVKQYVKKHGTGNINKSTLIDPENRGSIKR